jgi:hypothetical protein
MARRIDDQRNRVNHAKGVVDWEVFARFFQCNDPIKNSLDNSADSLYIYGFDNDSFP